MRNLMSKNRRDAVFILTQRKNACEDKDFASAAGQHSMTTLFIDLYVPWSHEGILLRAINDMDFPVHCL